MECDTCYVNITTLSDLWAFRIHFKTRCRVRTAIMRWRHNRKSVHARPKPITNAVWLLYAKMWKKANFKNTAKMQFLPCHGQWTLQYIFFLDSIFVGEYRVYRELIRSKTETRYTRMILKYHRKWNALKWYVAGLDYWSVDASLYLIWWSQFCNKSNKI